MTPPPLDRRVVPWLTAVAMVTLAPHFAYLPKWLTALVGVLLFWHGWRWTRWAGPLPRLLLVLLVVAGTAGILVEYRSIFGQEPGVALLALFMALKLLELRAPRDGYVVVMLGYFLLLTHYFTDESIPVGSWMLFALIVVTAALVRMQTPAAPVRETARLALLLVAQSLPMMFVLFLLFPRISGPLWGLPQDARKATTGLSEQMAPGSISELSQSAAIAFRARFAGAVPDRQALYWRGPVMTDFDGRNWRVGRAPPAAAPDIEPHSPAVAYSITLEAHQQRWLLALDLPVAVPADTTFSPALSLVRRQPVRERLRYEASSVTEYAVNVRENAEILRAALTLPAGSNPRARALAAGWRQATDRPQVLAARALTMFRQEAFVYTLQPPLLGQHAVDDFLFGSRRGFCEHYAAAFVFLMRAAGVPARVVAGYQGGEWNPVDGYVVVRQSDAHAWAEIWSETAGWVRVDPTAAIAPSRVEQGIAAALPAGEPLPGLVRSGVDWVRTLRYRWEALNNAWNQWVLGYDAERQRQLLSRFGLGGDWRGLIALLAGAAGVTLLAVSIWILRQPRRDPAQRHWQRFCRRLARLGIARESWEGPLDFAARIARTAPELAPVAAAAAQAYARLRYGEASGDDLDTLRRAVGQLPLLRRRASSRLW